MKILMIASLGMGLFISSISYSQDNFLKDYKAPDLKIRTMYTGLYGDNRTSIDTANLNTWGRFSSGVTFENFINTIYYQGSSYFRVYGAYNYWRTEDFKNRRFYSDFQSRSRHAFYLKKDWFLGFKESSSIQYQRNYMSTDTSGALQDLDVRLHPAVSIGHGRLEPVNYARMAMDINKLLHDSGQFSKNMSGGQLDTLSNKIAELSVMRFYDRRLGHIHRLEAIDSVMEEMGLVEERDMFYFSRLQDAYYYGRSSLRLSGFRQEMGISLNANMDFLDELVDNEAPDAAGIFYQIQYHLPASFSIQHSIYSTLITDINSLWWANRYEFGVYPNTRTRFAIGFRCNGFIRENIQGFVASTFIDGYYYISPRLRLRGELAFGYGMKYIPHRIPIVARDFNQFDNGRFFGNFRIGLNYAIF